MRSLRVGQYKYTPHMTYYTIYILQEAFLNSIVRILFKTDPPGFFECSYPLLLEKNSWKGIHQEILISTPRRFGKTISVCLFVAALIFACPNIEISIYSTCKRISQKLLRNCVRFLSMIHDVLHLPHMEFLKQSSDEVEIHGVEGKYDTRRLNSYPSKVFISIVKSIYIFTFKSTSPMKDPLKIILNTFKSTNP